MVVQAMDDASPTKWHPAHVTWFFETFILAKFLRGYRLFDERFNFCFNSYYESQGTRHPRSKRGLLTRPSIEDVFAYRAHVDEALGNLFAQGEPEGEIARLIEIGINHEQQHQELLLTDILALFASSPLWPAYTAPKPVSVSHKRPDGRRLDFLCGRHPSGRLRRRRLLVGQRGPRHAALIHPFKLADRLVTNGEWLAFIEDGGYRAASLWLADGWAAVHREGWQAPLYWDHVDGQWLAMSLEGRRPLDAAAPVSHVSYFEADAFARWSGKRLPTEFEWEVAAASAPLDANNLGSGAFKPLPAEKAAPGVPRQLFGDVWEWTQSAYLPYPGYRPPEGAIGEYNGKFMVSQQVLRGASCVTPKGHSRATYRNFFYPQQRWQFVGLRLAADGV